MSKSLVPTPIDVAVLETVQGGTKPGDALLRDITNLASQIKDVSKATSGFNSSQMLLLFLALQRNHPPATNVVYVARPRYYW
jgi:hypothetical protein